MQNVVLGTVWLLCDIKVGIHERESREVGTLNTRLRNSDFNYISSEELLRAYVCMVHLF